MQLLNKEPTPSVFALSSGKSVFKVGEKNENETITPQFRIVDSVLIGVKYTRKSKTWPFCN